MTVKEYAEYVGRKESTIRSAICRGVIERQLDKNGDIIINPDQEYTRQCAIRDKKAHYKNRSEIEKALASILRGMKRRCYNECDASYRFYGEKGIRICDEWLSDPDTFIEWAKANGYEKGLTIDRINNKGNYEPSNCRWITRSENSIHALRDTRVERQRMQEIESKNALDEAVAIETKKQWYVYRSIRLNPRYNVSPTVERKTEFYMDHLLTGFTETMLDNLFFIRHRQDFFRGENDNYYEIETPSREYIEKYVKVLYYLH